MSEKCDRCEEVGEDRRTLWHKCFYEMSELKIPFTKKETEDGIFYLLRVCKECRADWLYILEYWFSTKPKIERLPLRIETQSQP